MGGGLLLRRRQAGGSQEPRPRPCRLPAHPPARHTSSPAGLASSAHTATAPGPRAAAAGAGAGRRTPPCTRPFRPSSGPRVGPRGQQPACQGALTSSPASWSWLCAGRGVPCPTPPSPPGSGLPRTPQVSGRFSTASQGLWRIRGSRAAQSWDQHRQQGGRAGAPREPVHMLPSGAGTQPAGGAQHQHPAPRLLLPPSPVAGLGPEPGHTVQRSLEHLVGLWEQRGPSASGPPPPPPELGWAGSSPGPAPSSWTPAMSAPAPSLACSRVNGGTGSKPPC